MISWRPKSVGSDAIRGDPERIDLAAFEDPRENIVDHVALGDHPAHEKLNRAFARSSSSTRPISTGGTWFESCGARPSSSAHRASR